MTPSEPIRILCVDDEKNVLRALERAFMDDGYDILCAASGEEGLQILESVSPVRIVISDFRMPAMNGVEFLKRVRARWPETIRIVLSGYADTSAVVAAINEGRIYRFIPKPWNDDELRVTIAHALERYELERQNERLTEELRRKNEELEARNAELRQRIAEGSPSLFSKNMSLPLLESLVERIPVPVLGMDDAGRIRLSNAKAAAWIGRTPEEIAGGDRRTLLPEPANRLVESLGPGNGAMNTGAESWEGGEAWALRIPDANIPCSIILIARAEVPRG